LGSVGSTVTFDVGGEKFKVLEQTIRSKPSTLLCKLLDENAYKKLSEPIFVEGDPKLFRYILAWYRHGSIRLPTTVSRDEIRDECCFYQLPEDVRIVRESLAAAIYEVAENLEPMRKKARSDTRDTRLKALAALVFDRLVHAQTLLTTGDAKTELLQSTPSNCQLQFDPTSDTSAILALLYMHAEQHGWGVLAETEAGKATFTLQYQKETERSKSTD